jgi:hypothetical protein
MYTGVTARVSTACYEFRAAAASAAAAAVAATTASAGAASYCVAHHVSC